MRKHAAHWKLGWHSDPEGQRMQIEQDRERMWQNMVERQSTVEDLQKQEAEGTLHDRLEARHGCLVTLAQECMKVGEFERAPEARLVEKCCGCCRRWPARSGNARPSDPGSRRGSRGNQGEPAMPASARSPACASPTSTREWLPAPFAPLWRWCTGGCHRTEEPCPRMEVGTGSAGCQDS